MQNVEYKAELRDLNLARAIADTLQEPKAPYVTTARQVDTYYRVADGRLKKREVDGLPPEFILYSRPDHTKPKISEYMIYTEQQARDVLGSPLPPVWKVVKKVREIYTADGVRIHLDAVEDLGEFIEFEVLICPERDPARSHEVMNTLCTAFAPVMGRGIACSYVDLLGTIRKPATNRINETV